MRMRPRTSIDGFGAKTDRRGVRELMRRSGAEDRKAKAQAKRDRRAQKRTRDVEVEEV